MEDESSANSANQLLVEALRRGDEAGVRRALASGAEAHCQDNETGESVLMLAAAGDMVDAVSALIAAGAPWNAIDRQGRCAGDFAIERGNQVVIDMLVSAGVAAELVFSALGSTAVAAPRNADYLIGPASYSEDGTRLMQVGAEDAVMMEWERPIMAAHARALCENLLGDGARRPQLRILNIGFGLGIIDELFQAYRPDTHTIVEPHPDVLRRIENDGWMSRPGVRVVASRWQDVDLASLGPFDAVFFDTFGEYLEDLQEFHKMLPRILARPSGIYSFFNGMCPNSLFFQGVACEVVRLTLRRLGLELDFHRLEVDSGGDEVWAGVARRYFRSRDYYLPIARISSEATSLDDRPRVAQRRRELEEGDREFVNGAGKVSRERLEG